MERIKIIVTRYLQTIFLFSMGFILIVYLGLGALFLQQEPQRQDLESKIAKQSAILRTPIPSIDPLKGAFDNATAALAPIDDNVTVAMLVSLAKESDIDISEQSGKFQVPTPSHGGWSTYQVLSFNGIKIEGDHDKVEAFISLLDSDFPLKTSDSSSPRPIVRAVTSLITQDVVVTATGTEASRRAEFRNIIAAVAAMMKDNRLAISGIPNPVTKPTKYMGDDPTTLVFEGFPDVISTAANKGYTGNATPKNGYLLWEHDKISANTTDYNTTNYTQSLTTNYYYTCDTDGTVHQWDPFIKTKEYKDSKLTTVELQAILSINFYFKPK